MTGSQVFDDSDLRYADDERQSLLANWQNIRACSNWLGCWRPRAHWRFRNSLTPSQRPTAVRCAGGADSRAD